jgi:hypothetical protein
MRAAGRSTIAVIPRSLTVLGGRGDQGGGVPWAMHEGRRDRPVWRQRRVQPALATRITAVVSGTVYAAVG